MELWLVIISMKYVYAADDRTINTAVVISAGYVDKEYWRNLMEIKSLLIMYCNAVHR